MKMNREEIITYINSLKGYEGYVQFSDTPIEDIWTDRSDIAIDPGKGFVYEAHFFNGEESVAIKQVNDSWLISKTDISDIDQGDIQSYFAKSSNVKMAQIWEEKEDELCDGMKVMMLNKVVFAGFEKGGEV